MLTPAQLDYLQSQEIGVVVLANSGTRVIKGGDAQYDLYFAAPDAVDNYRDAVKIELNAMVDEAIGEKTPRANNPKYLSKQFGALLFKARNYSGSADDYKYLTEEALERGITNQEMADLIISASSAEMTKAAKIERRRTKLNIALDSATTIDQIYSLKQTAISEIDAL